jgi:hypothetical protein
MKLDFAMDDIVPVFAKVMLRYQGKSSACRTTATSTSCTGTSGLRARRQQGEVQGQVQIRPAAAEDVEAVGRRRRVLPRLGLGRSQQKLFGAGASYKPSGSGYSYHWWRSRFFSYGGNYFDANMKPLINTTAGCVRSTRWSRRCRTTRRRASVRVGEPKTMLVKGEVPLLYSWTSTGKRVAIPAESVIVGKAGFGLVPGADIDGKIINRPAITPGAAWPSRSTPRRKKPR